MCVCARKNIITQTHRDMYMYVESNNNNNNNEVIGLDWIGCCVKSLSLARPKEGRRNRETAPRLGDSTSNFILLHIFTGSDGFRLLVFSTWNFSFSFPFFFVFCFFFALLGICHSENAMGTKQGALTITCDLLQTIRLIQSFI